MQGSHSLDDVALNCCLDVQLKIAVNTPGIADSRKEALYLHLRVEHVLRDLIRSCPRMSAVPTKNYPVIEDQNPAASALHPVKQSNPEPFNHDPNTSTQAVLR
jgi:hypothetical protein